MTSSKTGKVTGVDPLFFEKGPNFHNTSAPGPPRNRRLSGPGGINVYTPVPRRSPRVSPALISPPSCSYRKHYFGDAIVYVMVKLVWKHAREIYIGACVM